MKTMKLLSYLAIIIIISTMVVTYLVSTKNKTYSLKENFKVMTYEPIKQTIQLSSQKPGAASTAKFKMEALTKPDIKSPQGNVTPAEPQKYIKDDALVTNEFDQTKFIIKIIFSAIFTVVCLYIVLSSKYDDGTKKWAFSVLSLITGVWIGAAV